MLQKFFDESANLLPGSRPLWWTAFGIGAWATLAASLGKPIAVIGAAAPVFLTALLFWILLTPGRWVPVFFIFLLLLPPLPVPMGNTGLHLAPAVALLGLFMGIIWIRKWRSPKHPVTLSFVAFVLVLLGSVALAALYSGLEIALSSLARVVLFSLSGYLFLYAYAGPDDTKSGAFRITKMLYWIAVLGACFACADFYFQFPAPAGYGDQFVYLQAGVFRRAQGVFYEASILGNFAAFFLVLVMVSFVRPSSEPPVGRRTLLAGSVVLFGALILSYSRGSMINIGVAGAIVGLIHLRQVRRAAGALTAAGVIVAVAVHVAAPAVSANYWGRLFGSFRFFEQAPDQILSGRLTHWQSLATFLSWEPWHVLLGVGYKTLPYSTFTGSRVVADNTYLELLVETGVAGLAAFLALNAAVLRTGWRAICSESPEARFFGEWIFCFWCGEVVQMMSGDLVTYWRVLPVYFWVLGAAARHTRGEA